jgi:lysophospholipase L1-like esterase
MVRRALSAVLGAALLGASACGSSPAAPTPPPTPGAPAITCPADVSVTSTAAPIAVTYTAPATSGGAPPTTVSCNVASGALLPSGTTAVSCTVTDGLNRTAACGFNITVAVKLYVKYTKYLAFGDSLTAGTVSTSSFGLRSLKNPDSYPGVLGALLAARYTQQTPTVVNEGLPGAPADDDTSRLRELLAAGPLPEVLLLLEGSNEMLTGRDDMVAKIGPALQEDIDAAWGANVKQILLATFPPTRSGSRGNVAGKYIEPTNTLIRNLQTTNASKGVILVDLHAAMVGQEQTLVGDDGLHLTIAGYRKMAETFLAVIKANFDQTTAPPSLFSFFRR